MQPLLKFVFSIVRVKRSPDYNILIAIHDTLQRCICTIGKHLSFRLIIGLNNCDLKLSVLLPNQIVLWAHMRSPSEVIIVTTQAKNIPQTGDFH